MSAKTPITVAYGDGIGPEIMTATLQILEAAGAAIAPDIIEIGEKAFLAGNSSGIPDTAWDTLKKNKVLLKAPITTPQGGGYKSLNVTLRKTLGLYANVRPCQALHPFIKTYFPNMDLVIVRENEEDLYAGIEHRQTEEVYQCLKLVTRSGCERICRHAFEYAEKYGRRKVTCFSKDNIMKLTDGIFHQTFDRIAKEYPHIENEHMIVDIGTALIATDPERFDIIVTSNLYGDIISDVAAQIVGSVGMAGSANVGDTFAMFEAIHGSAPDIAGKNIANPSGLLNGAVQMLIHVGQPEVATTIENAWLKTLEDGVHTVDIYGEPLSQEQVGTDGFAEAVIARLGQTPERFTPASYHLAEHHPTAAERASHSSPQAQTKTLMGVDIFIDKAGATAEDLARELQNLESPLQLSVISNRGVKVWPHGLVEGACSDHWPCRFVSTTAGEPITHSQVVALLGRLTDAGLDCIKTENLYCFDGERGYSLAQGE